MKYIKLFEDYNIKNEYVSKEKIIEFSKGKRFFDIDENYYNINTFFDELPNTLILERILLIKPNEKIDTDKLGIHFTFPDDRYPQFLWKIGLLDESMERDELLDIFENLKIVTIEVEKNNINFNDTAYHKINYIEENEITLEENANIKIIKVEKYEWDDGELEYPYEY